MYQILPVWNKTVPHEENNGHQMKLAEQPQRAIIPRKITQSQWLNQCSSGYRNLYNHWTTRDSNEGIMYPQ